MARKRTPTKEINEQNGRNCQDKNITNRLEEKKTSALDDTQYQPEPGPKISPVAILTVSVSIFTAVVCYIIYPELRSFATLGEKSLPSLRTLIEPSENRGISQNDFAPNIKSSVYSYLEKARDGVDNSELERIAEEIMRLHADTKSSAEELDVKDAQIEISSSKNVIDNEIVLDMKPAQLQNDQENEKSEKNEENLYTDGSANSDGISRIMTTEKIDGSSANENTAFVDKAELDIRRLDRVEEEIKDLPSSREIELKPGTDKENVNSGAKAVKAKDTQRTRPNPKPGKADTSNQFPPRKGKTKTAPVVLNAKNPHIQLNVRDIGGAVTFQQQEESKAEERRERNPLKTFSDPKRPKDKSGARISVDDKSEWDDKNTDFNSDSKVVKTKNIKKPKDIKTPAANSKSDVASSSFKLPPRDGTKKTSGPIVLSAENPHVKLELSEINSAIGQKQQDKIKIQQTKKSKSSSIKSNAREEAIRTDGSNKSINRSMKQTGKADSSSASNLDKQQKESAMPVKFKTIKEDTSRSGAESEEKSSSSKMKKSSKQEYKPSFQKTFSTKKIFYGGRRIAPVELLHQKPSNSSVKVFLFDDFLSEQECEGLMKAHDSHVRAYTKPPILCFDSISTLRKHIQDAGKKIKVTPKIFTSGTKCVNASFSLQMQTWLNSNWSYSTAFYPGESKFSTNVADRMQKTMGLKPENGGKFQITSYPLGKAYKTHTDCTLGGLDKRDRVVSVLMYLNDAEEGGETTFPELGIWVKPRRGRAIVWNNMNPAGVCEHHSRHEGSLVKKGKKYILIRWYYYKSFPNLGHRPSPPSLPQRENDQAMVSCDEYNSGSCRWYDEWSYDHITDYQQNKLDIS